MILLITYPGDLSICKVQDLLIYNQVPYHRICLEEVRLNDFELNWPTEQHFLRNKGTLIELQKISAVFYRGGKIPSLELTEKSLQSYSDLEHYSVNEFLFDYLRPFVINGSKFDSFSKLVHLKKAIEVGFNLLKTSLGANSIGLVKNIQEHIQLIDDNKIYIQHLRVGLGEESSIPAVVQEYLEFDFEVRVVFCFGNYYAVGQSGAKQLNRTRWNHSLPTHIIRKLKSFMSAIGLNFAAVEFLVKDQVYYFLECNPQGQYNMVEHICEASISIKITQKLIEYDRQYTHALEK